VNLRPDQLAAQLERPLAPLWLLHGNEPLLVLEAADAIRAAARRQGYEERETLVVGHGFKWDALALAAGNLSLFGGAKLIDLRIPTGKPGRDGGDALQRIAAVAAGLARRDAQVDQLGAAEERQVARGEGERVPLEAVADDQGLALLVALATGCGADCVGSLEHQQRLVAVQQPERRERALELGGELVGAQVHAGRRNGFSRCGGRRRGGA